ncbi:MULTISPECIES: hypothetical protein [Flavobacterium]|uniref:Signal peptidase n=1 Tax=Flavobacterium lipolyticum TaxID=2893754 RepID=A0ABS8LXY0_9FLAO|nr:MULTISPECIES: hypothetical protein [unclassified Flavobacterium]MCC9017445.1 hypothetical protein [Flavobacterium sp. F-126]
MKTIKTVFFTVCLTLLSGFSALAQVTPPAPGPVVPPDDPYDPDIVPIDNHLVFLAIVAVVLGIAIIYRNKIKKASV